uniref:Target of myb1 like 2 membrane trafficking protein n=1 Tax=Oryzias latipes TaxID=8090 RepID=A0A3P9IKN8_ORYLA
MEFLLGNPFTTPVGHCIERATDGSLQSEDWALNMEICDIINETEDGPKDAIRAVKKKLGGNKNYREVMLTLTAWADAFRSIPDLTGVVQVYEELKRKGIEFPTSEMETLSPIHTPQRVRPTRHMCKPRGPLPASFQPKMSLNILQICRLRSELDVVRGNTKVMSEMLTEMVPGQEEASDYELLQELNRTCRAMQQRIVELISCVSNEAVTEELLHVNDDLNNIFLRYERYERFRSGRSSAQSVNNGVLSEATEDNLIDLGPGSPAVVSNMARRPTSPATLASRLAGLDMGVDSVSSTLSSLNSCKPTPAQDDFDVFAQTRTGGRAVNRFVYWKSLFFFIWSAVFVAGICFIWWFSCRHSCDVFGFLQKGDEAEEGVTSEEFDKFLEERAKAAEMAPSLPSPPSGTPGEGQGTPGRKKPDRREDSLFAM